MGKLSDILSSAGNGGNIRDLWNSTGAADEFGHLPPGEYTAHIIAGILENAKTRGTPGYKLTFRVCEGEYTGRQFWHDIWLTEAALPMAKRDLAKLGVTSLEQLENPLPRGIRCRCKLVLRRGDDGAEFNKVRSFAVVGIDPPEADPYAPTDRTPPGEPDAAATGERTADAPTAAGSPDGTESKSEETAAGTPF